MAIDIREDLRLLIDRLHDDDLADARDVLGQLAAAREADGREQFAAWLVDSGLVRRLPQPSTEPPITRTPLLRISGEPVSKTLVDERR